VIIGVQEMTTSQLSVHKVSNSWTSRDWCLYFQKKADELIEKRKERPPP